MKLFNIVKRFAAVIAVTLSAGSFAADVQVNADANDLAIHGYDAVSYFSNSGPEKGKAKYSASYQDAIYHFASEANRDAFRENPEKYAPQFGGYCAMGVALNKKLDVDPLAWRVVDGKLYLNLNMKVHKQWLAKHEVFITRANAKWPGVLELKR